MKIFIDSADLEEIKQGYGWGVADGVTTNPSLLKKAVEKRIARGSIAGLDSVYYPNPRSRQGYSG